MQAPKPKSAKRSPMLAKVHIAKKDLGLDDETYRGILARITAQTSAAGLSDGQLEAVLTEFKRLGWKPKQTSASRAQADDAQSRKIRALWIGLAEAGAVKDKSEAALGAFVKRVTGRDALQWLRGNEPGKVIEALKSWAKRVGVATA